MFTAISVSAFGRPDSRDSPMSLQQASAQACRAAPGRVGRAACRSTKRSSWRSSRTSASRFSGSTRRFRTPASLRRDRSGRRNSARPASTGTRRRSSPRTRSLGSGASIAQRSRSSTGDLSTRRCRLGRELPRPTGTTRGHHDEPVQHLQPAGSVRTSTLQFTQPLLRNFKIDQIRQQVASSKKTRELSDIQLDGVIIRRCATSGTRTGIWRMRSTT